MVRLIDAQVISNEKLSPTVHKIILRTKKPFRYKAGQFIQVRTKTNGKPYSIASAPFEQDIELCIKRAGTFSNYMCNLKKRQKVKIAGPNGAFMINKPKSTTKKVEAQELIFVATGTGIAPIKAMLTTLMKNKDKRKITLYFGMRKQSGILYRKLFEGWEKEHKNFAFIPCLSRPPKTWKGETGHVDVVIKKQIKSAKRKEIYMCGLPLMVEGVEKLAKKIGFKKNQIFHEKFT